jgi:hypothetical protein
MSIVDELEQLTRLLERGMLTQKQFESAKVRLLGGKPDRPGDEAVGASTDSASVSEVQVALEAAALSTLYAFWETWTVVPPRIISATAFSLIALYAFFRVKNISLMLTVRLALLLAGVNAVSRWLVLPTRWEYLRGPSFVGLVEWGPLLNFQAPVAFSGAALMGAILAVLIRPSLLSSGSRWSLDDFWAWFSAHPRRLLGAAYVISAFLLLLMFLWDSSWAWIDLARSSAS